MTMLNAIDVPKTAAFPIKAEKESDEEFKNKSTLSKRVLVDCSLFSLKNMFRNEETKVLERFLFYVGPSLLFS